MMTTQTEITDATLAVAVEGWTSFDNPSDPQGATVRTKAYMGGNGKLRGTKLPDYAHNIADAMGLWGCLKSSQRFYVWNSVSSAVVSELHEFKGDLAALFAGAITEAVRELVRRGEIK